MSSSVTFNTPIIKARIVSDLVSVQAVIDTQVLKDSNYFCPEKDGILQASGLQSIPGSGVVAWNTPYADAQYYGLPNKSTDRNPNARMEWFEHAKSLYKSDWVEMANKTFGGTV